MTRSKRFIVWVPRVAGMLLAGFLALFALDAFDHTSFVGALPAFAAHLMPSVVVLALVAMAWRFEWIGAAGFIALALVYAVLVRGRLDWIAVISGPLTVIGVLFLVSWRRRGDQGYAAR